MPRAAAQVGAWALDVGSGVEAAPGRKDPAKLAAFFEALRPRRAGSGAMRLSGRFGAYGGAYVPEILVPALEQLEAAFLDAQEDPAFQAELDELLAKYAGRPTPLTRCRNLGAGKARIYLKREDLLHGGAHKTNQVLGQALARQADGQDPADRRDRRRPARRRDRDGRRAVRAARPASTWARTTSSGSSSTSSGCS